MNAETFREHFSVLAEAPNGVEKLRELILQLAVQGRLVPQDPCDEKIASTLERNDDRRRETAQNDHRADIENQPLLSADDRWDIPDTWSWRGLADLVLFVDYRGKTPTKLSNGIRLLTAKNVRKGQINLSPEEFLSERDYNDWMTRGFPKAGDVLFTTEAPMGNAAIVELTESFALAQRVICFQIYGAVDPAFLVMQILSEPFQFILDKNGTGVTAKGIKASKLKQLPIAVPPLAEQRRIVAKVDQLLGLCDELAARQAARHEARTVLVGATLDRLVSTPSSAEFPAHTHRLRNHFDRLFDTSTTIPQLRQAILQLAVQGQLVPQDPNDEPVDCDTCVEDYLTIQNGYAFKSQWFIPDGVRLVRNVNIGHGELKWGDVACISHDRAQEFRRFALSEGDIVISLDRPLISTGLKVARLTRADLPALLLQRVGRPEFADDRVVPDYFFIWLNSPAFTGTIDPGKSKGVPHIAAKDIHRINFAPPSRKTQKRIVARVIELLTLCDALEAKLAHAESASSQLLSAAVHHLLNANMVTPA